MSEWKAGMAFDSVLQVPLDYFDVTYANGHTVRYEKRPHGEWIELPKALNSNELPCKCSNCGHILSFMNYYPKSNFCPNCGADMRTKNVRSWDTSSRGVSGTVSDSITQKEGEQK